MRMASRDHPLTAATKPKRNAHFVDVAQVRLRKEFIVVNPFVLLRVGMCSLTQENESFDNGFTPSFSSSKSNCLVAARIRYNALKWFCNTPLEHVTKMFVVIS